MSGEPLPRQDVWQGADPWGHILKLDPQEQRVFRHMKDAVIPSGKHDQLVPVLLLELASPALPAHRFRSQGFLFTLQPVRGRQGEHQQGKRHMYPHGPRGFLRWMFQVPRLLSCLDTAVLNEAAVIIIIKRLQGLRHGGIGQEHRLTPRPIVPPRPCADYYPIDRVGREVAPMVVTPVCLRPILFIRRQPRDPDHLRFQPLAIRRAALPMADQVDSMADRPPSPAAASARASAVTAMCSLAGTTKRIPCCSSHHRSVPAKKPRSKTTLYRHV